MATPEDGCGGNEDPLLRALAEQFGLKVVNLEKVKPSPDALQIVPETMAAVYKVLPLSLRDNVLTVVVSDPSGVAALDDLKNFLAVKDVQAVIAPQRAIDEVTAEAYARQ